MTKEFRENILSWKFTEDIHGKKEDSIPFQLQKLFARMQLRLRDSESTEDLTKSFDWGHQQLLEQHDIQELCRVMFEAIELSLYNNENFINNLFQGFSTSVVKCLSCQNESNKKDRFLDISLPVRDDYEKIYNTSLEMAFMNFLKKEKLCGDNKYNCENCSTKSDALKYLKFTKLPKILFLQLNRFEYDYMTDGRKKICDRVTFPDLLNMNQFMKDYDEIKELLCQSKLNDLEKRENFNFEKNEEEKKCITESYFLEGEYVYELFSVVVHSGCARGGHYYSFIKSFEDKKWYRFDDCHVYEADIKNIEYTFGESVRQGLNAVTGYILMYRKIENNENDLKIENKIKIENSEKINLINSNFEKNENKNGTILNNSIDNNLIFQNSELMKIIEEENIQILLEEERQKDKLNTLQLKFFYNDKIINILSKKNQKISELKSRVLQEFELVQVLPKNARLRCVNNQSYKMLEAYSLFDEDKTLEEANPPIVQHKTYGIEIKSDCEEFEEYNPNLIVLSIIKWEDRLATLEEKDLKFEKIKIDKKKLLKDLKNEIYKYFKIGKDKEDMNFSESQKSQKEIFLLKKVDYASNNFQLTEIKFTEEEMEKELYSPPLLLSDNSKLFLEIKNENWTESHFIKFFDDNSAGVLVKFNIPLKKENLNNSKEPSTSIKKRITLNSYRFDNQLEIKKSRSLLDLKKKISEVLQISEKEFIMKKNSHNGPELKSLNDTIDKYATNLLTVYIELGSPQKDSEIKINLFTCEYDFSFFLVFPYKVVDSGFFIVDINWSIKQLKEFLITELEKKLNSGQNINFKLENICIDTLLIRDYKNDRPAKIYSDDLILGQDLQFSENKKIILQKYSNVLHPFNQSDIQCSIREWDPQNWKISQPVEFHINKGMTFLEFASKVIEYFPHLNPEKISAFKIQNEMNVFMDDFIKYKVRKLQNYRIIFIL
jgi:hypothetical protein